MKKIQILSPDNGSGLTVDRNILIDALKGFEVSWCDPLKNKPDSNVDVYIHLEIIYSKHFDKKIKQVGILNPEWFFPYWNGQFHKFNLICAKTKDAENIFKRFNSNTVYTSFTSPCIKNHVPRERKFVHFAGKSEAKGTAQILKAFALPGMPELTIYCHGAFDSKDIPNRVTVVRQKLSEEDYNREFNKCIFHLCPSEYEGFGHYINEAKSVGAIILTTNAAPMNELCLSSFSFGVPWVSFGKQNLGCMFKADFREIAKQVKVMENLTDDNIKLFGERAENSFWQNDSFFRKNILNVFNNL